LLIRGYEQLLAQFRIPQYYGGDEAIVINATIYNDTGSQIQTIYQHDFDQLNGPGRHLFPPQPSLINTPNGPAMLATVSMEIRIIRRKPNGEVKALTDWMPEMFVIRNFNHGQTLLLSGAAMRQRLYFATAPGNDFLYVSVKKHGIVSQLPVV